MRNFNYRNQIILNNKNYCNWRERTAIILRAERVYSSIEVDPRFTIDNDRDARAVEILNRLLDKEHQLLVQDCEAAKDIWSKLENLYSDQRRQELELKSKEILKQLENYKMSKSADTLTTVKTMTKIMDTLVENGVDLTEDECINFIKNAMSDRFDSFENLWKVICKGGNKLEILNALIMAGSTLAKQFASVKEDRKMIEGVNSVELTPISMETPPAKKARVEEKEVVVEFDSRFEKQKPPKENYNHHRKDRRSSSSADSAKYSGAKRQFLSSSRSSVGYNYEKKQRNSLRTPSSSASLPGQATTISTLKAASLSAPTSSSASVSKTSEKRRPSDSRDRSITLEHSKLDSCAKNEDETSAIKSIDATKVPGRDVITSPDITKFLEFSKATSSAVIVTKTNSAGKVINIPSFTLNTIRSAKKMTESELSRVGISPHFLTPAKFNAQSKESIIL